MHKFIGKTIKATIINIIVALFSTIVLLAVIYLFFGAEIDETVSLINKVAIDVESKEEKPTIMTEENTIKNYPEYGTTYATNYNLI